MKSLNLRPGSGKPRNVKAIAAVAAGLIAVLALGYLVLIGPQRSRAAELSEEIATTEQQLAAARAAGLTRPEPTRVDRIFRLTKAMPDRTDMPGILLELSRIASETGIRFDSITPNAATPGTSFQTVPVQLVFRGNYYELSDFLFRLRNLVGKQGEGLNVTGRLYSVDGVDFTQAGESASLLEAKLTAKAYIYGTGATATPVTPTTPAPGAAG